jgi:WD40 repeat protein
MAFSPDGRTLATAGDGRVTLWNAGTRVRYARLAADGVIDAVAFRPDGQLIAGAGADGTVRLWDVAGRRLVRTLKGHTDPVRALAFSPDGRSLASAGNDGTVRLWDVASGRCTATLTGHVGFVSGVAFTLDGRTVVSASDDQTVRLWDPATGQQREAFGRPVSTADPDKPTYVYHGAWYPLAVRRDSRIIATGGVGVLLWDTMTGRPVATLGPDREARSLAFSRDGRTLAIGDSHDHTVELWSVRLP